jgi:hypothetical protein
MEESEFDQNQIYYYNNNNQMPFNNEEELSEYEVKEDLIKIHEIKDIKNKSNNNYYSQTYQQPSRKIINKNDYNDNTYYNTYEETDDYYPTSTKSVENNYKTYYQYKSQTQDNFYNKKHILCPDCADKEKEKSKKKEVLCCECEHELEREAKIKENKKNEKNIEINKSNNEEIINNNKREEYKIEESLNNYEDGEQIKIGYVNAPFLVEEKEDNNNNTTKLNDSEKKYIIDFILKELDKEEEMEKNCEFEEISCLKILFKLLNEKDKKYIVEEIKNKIKDEKKEQKFNSFIFMLE